MVLEGVLEHFLLNRLSLGDWILNLDRRQLKLDIWSGSLTLKSLQLNPAVLLKYDLPVRVKYATIDELRIDIPWHAIKTQPVHIHVSGVYVLMETITTTASNESSSSSSSTSSDAVLTARAVHRGKISEAEQIRQVKRLASTQKDEGEATFLENMMAAILANLQVTVEKLHIRLEHPAPTVNTISSTSLSSASSAPATTAPQTNLAFAVGLSIVSLTTQAAASSAPSLAPSPSSSDLKHADVSKTLTCTDVALYCNPTSRSWTTLPPPAMHVTFSNSIPSCRTAALQNAHSLEAIWWRNNASKAAHHRMTYLLYPLSLTLNVRLNRKDLIQPYCTIECNLPSLPLALTNTQLSVLVQATELYAATRHKEKQMIERIIRSCEKMKPKDRPMRYDLPPVREENESKEENELTASSSPAAATTPSSSSLPRSNCRLWWRWSVQCIILLTNRSKRDRRTLIQASSETEAKVKSASSSTSSSKSSTSSPTTNLTLLTRAHLFREYVLLYKRSLGASWHTPLTDTEKTRMEMIEYLLSVSDIMWYRTCADEELLSEAKNVARKKEVQRVEDKKKGFVAGWYGYLTGTDAASTAAASVDTDNPAELTKEQKEAILDMIGSTSSASSASASSSSAASTAAAAVMSPSYTLYAFSLNISETSLELIEVDRTSAPISTLPSSNSSLSSTAVPSSSSFSSSSSTTNKTPQKATIITKLSVHDIAMNIDVKPMRNDSTRKATSVPSAASPAKARSSAAAPSSASDTDSNLHPLECRFTVGSFDIEDCVSSKKETVKIAWSEEIDGDATSSSSSFLTSSYYLAPLDQTCDHRLHFQMSRIICRLHPYYLARVVRIIPISVSNSATKKAVNEAIDSVASSSSSTSSSPLHLTSLATSTFSDMQSSFVESLRRQRRWDVKVDMTGVEMRVPQLIENDSKEEEDTNPSASPDPRASPVPTPAPSQCLVFSTGHILLRSQHALSESSEQASPLSPTSHPLVLQRNLPAALHQYPHAYERFTLDVDGVAVKWSNDGEDKDEKLSILNPLSLHLSLHLLTRPRLRGITSDALLLLPRVIIAGFLPSIDISVTSSLIQFTRQWTWQTRRALAKAKVEEQLGLAESVLTGKKNGGEEEVNPKPDVKEEHSNEPHTNVHANEASNLPVVELPPVRTQFHGYFGIGNVTITLYTNDTEFTASSSSSASSITSASPRPLLRLSSLGCSTLFIISSLESNIRVGCESMLVTGLSHSDPERPVTIASITSKHLVFAPGGTVGSTSLLRTPSLLLASQDSNGDSEEALQFRIITLLGAALRVRPAQYTSRPLSKQYIDAMISCVTVEWKPHIMNECVEWIESMEWGSKNSASVPADPAKSIHQESSASSSKPSSSDESKDSIEAITSTSSLLDLTPAVPSAVTRFLTLITSRIDEFSFNCHTESHNAAVSAPASPLIDPPPLFQFQLRSLYLKQAVYTRDRWTGVPNDYLLIAGVKEVVVKECENGDAADSNDLPSTSSPAPRQYEEMLTCRVDEMSEAFDEEEEEKKEDLYDNEAKEASSSSIPLHNPAVRELLPAHASPLLLTLSIRPSTSPRFSPDDNEGSTCHATIRGVSCVYFRARTERLIEYMTTGVLGRLTTSSGAGIGSKVMEKYTQHQQQQRHLRSSLHLSAVHPTILVPRSYEAKHAKEYVKFDLGHIEVHAETKVGGGEEEEKKSTPSDSSASSTTTASLDEEDVTTSYPAHYYKDDLLSLTHIRINISKMNLATPTTQQASAVQQQDVVYFPGAEIPSSSSPDSQLTSMMHDITFSLDLRLTALLPSQSSSLSSPPHLLIRSKLSDILTRITHEQYLLLVNIAFDNLFIGMVYEQQHVKKLPSPLPSARASKPAEVESKEAEEARLSAESASSAPFISSSPPTYQSMSMDVRFQVDRFRVELISPFATSSSLPSVFASFTMDEFRIYHRMSAERGIIINCTTRRMSIQDERRESGGSEQVVAGAKTIFYPLPTASLDSSSVEKPIDEMCISFSHHFPSATLDGSSSLDDELPPPDRLTVVLSNPCILVLPDFWLMFMEFVSLSPTVQTDEADSLLAPLSPTSTPVHPDTNLVQRLYWLDLHVSVHNARAILPQSPAADAAAVIVTCDAHLTSTNSKHQEKESVSVEVSKNQSSSSSKSVRSSSASTPRERTQEVELTISNGQCFGGTTLHPLLSSLPHRICLCDSVHLALHSIFRDAIEEDEDDEEQKKDASNNIQSSLHETVTTTAAITFDPVKLQISYHDIKRLQQIQEYVLREVGELKDMKTKFQQTMINQQQVSRTHSSADALASSVPHTTPSYQRQSSRQKRDWTAHEIEQQKAFIRQQQIAYQNNPCVIVPVVLKEEDDEDDEEEKKQNEAKSKKASESSTFFPSASLFSFGWFQFIEVRCVSLSFILLNDLITGDVSVATSSSAASKHPLPLPIGSNIVPVCHICVFDTNIIWSHPRSYSNNHPSTRGADATRISDDTTDLKHITLRTNVSLTLYDAINIEWLQVMQKCAYEATVEMKTMMQQQQALVAVPTRKSTLRKSSTHAAPRERKKKTQLMIQFSSLDAQEIHVSDRVLSAILQLSKQFSESSVKESTVPRKATLALPASSSFPSSSSFSSSSTTRDTFFSPFIISNSTHNTLRCTINVHSRVRSGGDSNGNNLIAHELVIEPGEEQAVSLPELTSHLLSGNQLLFTSASFSFLYNKALKSDDMILSGISSFSPLQNVSLAKTGTFVHELGLAESSSPSGTYVEVVIAHVSAASNAISSSEASPSSGSFSGQKRIELRSLTSFTNSTNLPLDLRLLPRRGGYLAPPLPYYNLPTVEPSQTIYLPLDEPTFTWVSCEYRPTGFASGWSVCGGGGNDEKKQQDKNMSGGQGIIREKVIQQERTAAVTVCSMSELDVDGDESAAVNKFITHTITHCQKHIIVKKVTSKDIKNQQRMRSPSTAASSPSFEDVSLDLDLDQIITYHRLSLTVYPPLQLTNLFLSNMNYQMKYRSINSIPSALQASGTLKSGDAIHIHDVDILRQPMLRYQLAPELGKNSKVSPQQNSWSEWYSLEQMSKQTIIECMLQVAQSNNGADSSAAQPSIPLLTQIHRCTNRLSHTISLTFLCPYWLNNQSGIELAYTRCDEIYENERFLFFKWRSPSLPTDRSQWSTRDGSDSRLPPPHQASASSISGVSQSAIPNMPDFYWLPEQGWQVEISRERTDENGWTYALDFPGPYSNANSTLDAVRRRRWFRHRALRMLRNNELEEKAPQAASSSAFLPSSSSFSSSSSSSIDPLAPLNPSAITRHVRMYGSPLQASSPPSFSIYAVGSSMPPSQPLDVSRIATDTMLLLTEPRSHRAPGNAVRTYELAVLVDTPPSPFHQSIKLISFHARYTLHNHTPLSLIARQLGLDTRNPKFSLELKSGDAKAFHPWLCTPPVSSPSSSPSSHSSSAMQVSNRLGLHLRCGESEWSCPFPIQRIGEFSISFPVSGSAAEMESNQKSSMMASSPSSSTYAMYTFRIRIELVRTMLHIYIMPESMFLNVPSSLHLESDGAANHALVPSSSSSSMASAAGTVMSGSQYRIDNHTFHSLRLSQKLRSAPGGGAPNTQAKMISAHTSSIYTFEHHDLSILSSSASDPPSSVTPSSSHTLLIEVRQHLNELEQLQAIEREFNGLPAAPGGFGSASSASVSSFLSTQINLDEVGAEAYVKLPNTYAVVPAPAHIKKSIASAAALASDETPGNPDAFDPSSLPTSMLQCRALHFLVVPDGATRVLVVHEVDYDETLEEDNEYENARNAIRPSSTLDDDEEKVNDDEAPLFVNVTLQMKEINVIFFTRAEALSASMSGGSSLTSSSSSSSPRPTPTGSSSSSASDSPAPHTLDIVKKWRNVPKRGSGAASSVYDVTSSSQKEHEILFFQLSSLSFDYTYTHELQSLQVRLHKFQVDNPAVNAIYPVVMHSIQDERKSAQQQQQYPAFQCFVSIPRQPSSSSSSLNNSSSSAHSSLTPFYINRFVVQLNTFRINGDEELMRTMSMFMEAAMNGVSSDNANLATSSSAGKKKRRNSSASLAKHQPRTITANMDQLPAFLLARDASSHAASSSRSASSFPRMYYFRHFSISPFRLRISYTPVQFIPTPHMPRDPLKPFHRTLGSIRPFLDADDAKLVFDEIERRKLYVSLKRLMNELSKIYSADATSQALELLGSAKAFGNPLGVLSSVRTGLRDLVSDPSLSRGAKSFVNNTTAGVSGGAAGVTSSLGARVAKLSGDTEYQSQRAQHLTSDRPRTAGEGVRSGFKHFGAGFLDGVTGLVSQPAAGMKSGGVSGAVAGAGRGVLGLLTKPIAGTLDAVQKVSEGVRAQAVSGTQKGAHATQKIERAPSHGTRAQQQQQQQQQQQSSSSPASSSSNVPRKSSTAGTASPQLYPASMRVASTSISANSPGPAVASSSATPPVSSSSSSSSAASSASPAGAAAASSDMWRCASCSCFNPHSTRECIMCGQQRDDDGDGLP